MAVGFPAPDIQFSSWKNAEVADPVGTRHLVSGAFAYDKLIGLGCDSALPFNGLRLNAANNTPFVGSDVAVVNVSIPNFGELQSSGVTALYNMRLWLPAGSGTVLSLPGIHLQYQTNSAWTPNLSFPSGAGSEFPTALPGGHNLNRIDGDSRITSYNDANVSEWVYIRLFLDINFPIGTFGACGSGLLRLRLTYDFF